MYLRSDNIFEPDIAVSSDSEDLAHGPLITSLLYPDDFREDLDEDGFVEYERSLRASQDPFYLRLLIRMWQAREKFRELHRRLNNSKDRDFKFLCP